MLLEVILTIHFKDDYDYNCDDDDVLHFELVRCKLSPAITCSNKGRKNTAIYEQ